MIRITETVKILIIINVLFFVGTMTLNDTAYHLFSEYFILHPSFQIWQPVTSMFMHFGPMHLLFNMLGLWMFGGPLEQIWGRNKFLFFYFSCGLGSFLLSQGMDFYSFNTGLEGIVSAGFEKQEILVTLKDGLYNTGWVDILGQESFDGFMKIFNTRSAGASGAVMGLLVAFGMFHPNSSISPMFLPISIKAKYYIPVLLAYEIFSGFVGSSSLFGMNVGHWAHVGGALFGFVMAYYWKKNSFNSKRWN